MTVFGMVEALDKPCYACVTILSTPAREELRTCGGYAISASHVVGWRSWNLIVAPIDNYYHHPPQKNDPGGRP